MDQQTPIIVTGDNIEGQLILIAASKKTFEQFQSELLELAEQHDACSDAIKELESAETIEELLQVVKDNIAWCCKNLTDCADKLITYFGNDLLHKFNIYTSGTFSIHITEANTAIALLGSSSATVETWGSSSATVKTWGSSSATVKTWGSSSATVKTCDSSSATVKTCDSSSATVETWGSSSATVETCDSSSATVETCDSSSATVKTWGSSSATVETWGSSSANIGRYHLSKLEHSLADGPCPLIKHLTEKKVFVKTSDFEIVQVSK